MIKPLYKYLVIYLTHLKLLFFETGLIALIHNNIDNPFPKPGKPNYIDGMKDLIKRHPETTIIWAYMDVGMIIKPIEDILTMAEQILSDPAYDQMYFNVSWDEVAKYVIANEKSLNNMAYIVNKYPDRFLFGTDNVAPSIQVLIYFLFIVVVLFAILCTVF